MRTPKLSKKEIEKIVSNSGEIEGYKKAPKKIIEQAKELMAKNNVKIST